MCRFINCWLCKVSKDHDQIELANLREEVEQDNNE